MSKYSATDCQAEEVRILKGFVSKDHFHMHIEYRPNKDLSSLIKLFKGKCSINLQLQFHELKKLYFGRHF
ncbi:transposase [Chryseobacterium sp. SL1]|nr:transposase [Chryseobacterium sp. SL1]MCY1661943.1 transposase [Chryseobacterium sp. SL1]